MITTEVTDEYGHLSITTLIQALKNGGRGKYGRTYLLSVQEIFIWIDSYIKENPNEKDERYIYYQWMNDPSVMVRRVLKSEAEEMFKGQETAGYTYKVIKNIKNKNKTWK